MAQWIGEHAIPVHLDFDADEADRESLGVTAFPTTVVLDSNGKILDSRRGGMSADSLIEMLEEGRRLQAAGAGG